jgi:hypothetical protein
MQMLDEIPKVSVLTGGEAFLCKAYSAFEQMLWLTKLVSSDSLTLIASARDLGLTILLGQD